MLKRLKPIHPGEILKEDLLDPMGISEYRLARDIGVPPRRINEIVHGTRSITADTALRLGAYFKMSAEFWMNLQNGYDLRIQERSAPFSSLNRHFWSEHSLSKELVSESKKIAVHLKNRLQK